MKLLISGLKFKSNLTKFNSDNDKDNSVKFRSIYYKLPLIENSNFYNYLKFFKLIENC